MSQVAKIDREEARHGEWIIRCRVGWGWEVLGPDNFKSVPMGSFACCDNYAALRHLGKTHQEAWHMTNPITRDQTSRY